MGDFAFAFVVVKSLVMFTLYCHMNTPMMIHKSESVILCFSNLFPFLLLCVLLECWLYFLF